MAANERRARQPRRGPRRTRPQARPVLPAHAAFCRRHHNASTATTTLTSMSNPSLEKSLDEIIGENKSERRARGLRGGRSRGAKGVSSHGAKGVSKPVRLEPLLFLSI